MQYEDLFKALSIADVHYLVCGGLAMNIYGIPRMTADIDLLVDFEKSNLEKLKTVFENLSYRNTIPVSLLDLAEKTKRDELKREKNMIAFSFFNSHSNFMSVDVLIDSPISFEELWKSKETRKLGEHEVHLVSVQNLIELKDYAGRAQDKGDVILLSKLLNKK